MWGWEEARVPDGRLGSNGPGSSGQEAPSPSLIPLPGLPICLLEDSNAHIGTLPPRTIARLLGVVGARRGFGNKIQCTSCEKNHHNELSISSKVAHQKRKV